MTDQTPTGQPAAPSGPPDEAGEAAPLPVDRVRDLFVLLGKALRAFQLYDENNPVYQRFVSSLQSAFAELWTKIDSLPVAVEEDRFIWLGEEVYRANSRNESIAFLFFKDGVREITFLPGIEGDELVRLLGVIQSARHAGSVGDDLLTILWEADLTFFKYQFLDLLAEGLEIPEGSAEPLGHMGQLVQEVVAEPEPQEAEEGEGEEEGADGQPAAPVTSVSREDFNPTLYALDPSEMDELRRELDAEMNRNLRTGVLAALFDRLEEPANRTRQSEIIGILRLLLPNLLSRGNLSAVAGVVRELSRVKDTPGVFDEERAAEIEGLFDELSSPAAVEELVQALEDGTIKPDPDALTGFLSHLNVGALAPLFRSSELSGDRGVGPVLTEAAKGIGANNKQAVLDLLKSPDPMVAMGAARLAGSVKMEEAGPALSSLMTHPDPGVRRVAVESGRDLNVNTVTSGMQAALKDTDPEVRIAAARALGAMAFGPAAPKFKAIIEGKAIRSAELSEKIAFFEAYGLVAREDAVPALDQLLNGRGFLGRKESPEIRACAALALGRVGSERALLILHRAAAETDPVIRNAVGRALKGGE